MSPTSSDHKPPAPVTSNPKRRLALALALSILAHVLIIWTPHFSLPHIHTPLPEITVKLNPLPKTPAKPRKKTRPKAPPKAHVTPPPAATPQAAPLSSHEPAVTPTLPASAVAASQPASAPAATEAAPAPAATETLPQPEKIPFPKHVLLTFAVRSGNDGFRLGEVQHSLDITDNQYIVQSYTRTSGIARWFKSFNLNQTSTGTVSGQGLKPDNFAEAKINSGDLQTLTAVFDWENHQVMFSSGESATLPDGTQDALSILYQLALSKLNAEIIPVNISTGKKLDSFRLEIATKKIISTPIGDLNTVQLRRIREPGQAGLIIWLATEYRLLPVKIQYLEPDGTISATISATEIRYTDD